MTYLTEEQIKSAIDAWAEPQVDAEIERRIQRNKEYVEKYGENSYFRSPTTVDGFNRNEVRNSIAERVYDSNEIDIPGIGHLKLVDAYGGEGLGSEYYRVYEVDGKFYKADHYYDSYDVDPWHGNASWFPVVGREKVVTEWVSPS